MKLKSASCQIAYWEGGRLRIANYLTRRTFSTNPVTLDRDPFLLHPADDPGCARRVPLLQPGERRQGDTAADRWRSSCSSTAQPNGSGMNWSSRHGDPWLPEGGFHFMTKDTPYVPSGLAHRGENEGASDNSGPAPVQNGSGRRYNPAAVARIAKDTFFETLHARRTHRDFARGKVSLENVSKLLQTTWGVQGYFQTNVFGKLPYKTSPSGGARHPGEVYLMALRVDGLERGMYHYHARDNRLARLPAKVTPRMASAYCADQP